MLPVTIEEFTLGCLDAFAVCCMICIVLAPLRAHAIKGVLPLLVVATAYGYCAVAGLAVEEIFTVTALVAGGGGGVVFAWMRLAESFAAMNLLEATHSTQNLNLVVNNAFARGVRTPATLAVILYDSGLATSEDSLAIAPIICAQRTANRALVILAAVAAGFGIAGLVAERYEFGFFGAGLAVFLLSIKWRARTILRHEGQLQEFPGPRIRALALLAVWCGSFIALQNWVDGAFSLLAGNLIVIAAIVFLGPVLFAITAGSRTAPAAEQQASESSQV